MLGKNNPQDIEVILAKHAKEFIEFCLSNYQCFWLTTHCNDGDPKNLMKMFRSYADSAVMELLKNIKPTQWKTFKSEAIDFSSNFYWIEDQLMSYEIDQLKKNNAFDRWIKIDTRKQPNDLRRALSILKKHQLL